MSEARARLELREVVTASDAKDVIEIMKMSMLDVFSDDIGTVDFQRSQHGSGMSKKAQAKHFIAELGRQADANYNSMFTVPEMQKIAHQVGHLHEMHTLP